MQFPKQIVHFGHREVTEGNARLKAGIFPAQVLQQGSVRSKNIQI